MHAMKTRKIPLMVGTIVSASALILSGCAADDGNPNTATGEPIVVASINALSGPVTFAEASEAAKSVFDDYNANGGLDGRPIDYRIFDDKADPAAASSAARDAVTAGAVALVGSASILECEVNHSYYVEQQILSIQGTGVDPFCFDSPNIAPVNTGPFFDTTLTLLHGSETLGLEKICALVAIAGSTEPAYREAIQTWSEATGKSIHWEDYSVPYGNADFAPYLIQAKQQGCDGIYSNVVESEGAALLKVAESQGLNDLTFLLLTSVYSEQFAAQANFVGKGIYVPAEFAPYTDADSEANAEWAALMDAQSIAKTSFGQGGYLAAKNFIEVLESIDGEITRASVTEALLNQQTPIESPMVGTPWIFGTAEAHQPNQAGWIVTIAPGSSQWASEGDDWVKL